MRKILFKMIFSILIKIKTINSLYFSKIAKIIKMQLLQTSPHLMITTITMKRNVLTLST